jgi:hypothetical protein
MNRSMAFGMIWKGLLNKNSKPKKGKASWNTPSIVPSARTVSTVGSGSGSGLEGLIGLANMPNMTHLIQK